MAGLLPYIKSNDTKVSGNFDDFTSIGIYLLAGNTADFDNAPQAQSIEGILIVFKGLNLVFQIFAYCQQPEIYIRSLYATKWRSWVKL